MSASSDEEIQLMEVSNLSDWLVYFLTKGEATYVEKVHNDDIEFAKHEEGSFFGHLDFFRSPDD